MISIRKQVELKIRLERIFEPEVKKVFNAIIKDFKIRLAATGAPPDIKAYKAIWEMIIKNHFKRVQRAFVSSTKKADDDILSVFLDWNNKVAPLDAEYINETTRENMNEAIQAAIAEAAEELKVLTTRELSAKSAAILKRKIKSRLQRIINTETQKAAEAAKFMEAEQISGLTPRIQGGNAFQRTDTQKRWTTVGDKFVRPIHNDANGQIRNLTEPYEVGGELLMHPGDDSLGASLGNLANCRCVSTYSFI